MACIYKIVNPKGYVYVGQTTNLKQRKRSYERLEVHNQVKIRNSLLKYGWDNHTFEVVEECSIELLNERERYWQEFYNCIGKHGLNCRLTKTTDKSGLFSSESKEKMSIVGKTHLAKIEKLKASRHDWTGKKHSPETKERMRLAAIGIPKTKEHIAKLPQNQKGKFRAKDSEETKMKKLLSSPRTKKVIQLTLDGQFVNEYLSCNYAAKQLGLKRGTNIHYAAKGRLKQAYGFKWAFAEIQTNSLT